MAQKLLVKYQNNKYILSQDIKMNDAGWVWKEVSFVGFSYFVCMCR